MIYLIRHAEPSIAGVLLGRLDPPLRSVPPPSELAVSSVFTSPLRRARDTAASLFPLIQATVLEELVEISLGEWDGLAWAQVEQRDPALSARKVEDWFSVTPPGGENYETILRRAAASLTVVRQSAQPVAIVAHAGINAVLWQLLTGSAAAAYQQDYLEVKTYAYPD